MLGDRVGVGVEVEESAQAGDDRHQLRGELGREAHAQRRASRIGVDAQPADAAAERDDAGVAVVVDVLDAGDLAPAQEPEQRGPVERRPVVETQLDRVTGRDLGALAPQRRRRPAEALLHERVEAAHAGEPGRICDLRERQRGVLQQLLGEREPPRLRQLDRRRPELRLERAPQVTPADAEAPGQRVDRTVVEVAGVDARERGGGEPRQGVDRRPPRRELGPAAQAGTKADALGLGGAAKELAAAAPGVRAGQTGRQ
nr:hypothetical protein [Nannocystis pusilla]